MNYPIVKIVWRDSNQFSKEYKITEAMKTFSICTLTSIGYLIGYDNKNPIISREFSPENRSVRGSIVIPHENIIEMITVIENPEVIKKKTS